MVAMEIDRTPAPRAVSTRELRAEGWTKRRIAVSVGDGSLVRMHRGTYGAPTLADGCLAAGRMRGRLACVSEMKRRGVFVLSVDGLHVHIPPTSSRLGQVRSARVHREELRRAPHPAALSVEPFDALVQAMRCQSRRGALATLESALHHGLIRTDEVDELFAALPRRYRSLRRVLNPRSESGPETLMRLILLSLGCRVDVQVRIAGVGRVDFVVDGWLIVECDSRDHHSSWELQRRDRRRDQAAAVRGYATFRPIAEDIMWHEDEVRAAVIGLRRIRR